MKTILAFVAFTLCLGSAPLGERTAAAVSITVIGHWEPSIVVRPLTAGRESGLQSTYESAVNQIRLRISGSAGNWKVSVRKEDTNWHPNLVLKIRKSSGKDKPIVTVQNTNMEFFSGDRDTNAHLQLTLEGVSVEVPPDTYTTTVIYTITEE